jgi:ribonuclease R
VGDVLEARVSGVSESTLFALAASPFVELKIPVDRLGGDRYELDRLGVRLVGVKTKHAFALGDVIAVRIEEVSIERREIVGSLPSAKAKKAEPEGPRAQRARPQTRPRKGKR